MFFGVNIGSISEHSHIREKEIQKFNAKSKYGVPVPTKWEIHLENISEEASWQDVKDFCYEKSRVRPSFADAHKANLGTATICCSTEEEMKIVFRRLHGAKFGGRRIKASIASEVGRSQTNAFRHTRKPRSSDDHKNHILKRPFSKHENDRPKQHNFDKHENNHSKKRHTMNEHEADPPKKQRSSFENERNHESRIVVHDVNGDRVITEKIGTDDSGSNIDELDSSHELNTDTSRRARYKKPRYSNGESSNFRKHIPHKIFSNKTHAVKKYGIPYKTIWKVRVENLSSNVSWQDLKDLFRSHADIKYADAHKPFKGIGNVCVGSHEALQNLINKMDGKEVKGETIRLFDESDKEMVKNQSRSTGRSTKIRSRSTMDKPEHGS